MPKISWSKTKKRIRRMLLPSVTPERLASELADLGVQPNGMLMVHSSLSSLGNLKNGPEGLIQALRLCVAEGTLAMPAHSWRAVNSGSREFSVNDTPSCVGITCERFREQNDVIRSLHPTHSVAATGPDAEWLTRGHESAGSPCGESTPYDKLIEKSAQVLFVGVRLDRNTLFHTVETMADLSYALDASDQPFDITDATGRCSKMRFRLHQQGIPRKFAEAEKFLVEKGVVNVGFAGGARMILLHASPFTKVMLEKLEQEPDFLKG